MASDGRFSAVVGVTVCTDGMRIINTDGHRKGQSNCALIRGSVVVGNEGETRQLKATRVQEPRRRRADLQSAAFRLALTCSLSPRSPPLSFFLFSPGKVSLVVLALPGCFQLDDHTVTSPYPYGFSVPVIDLGI